MQWLEAIHDIKNSIHERLSLTIIQVPQRYPTAQVRGLIGVTAGTPERAFARDLD
jgi:hypothetical protein